VVLFLLLLLGRLPTTPIYGEDKEIRSQVIDRELTKRDNDLVLQDITSQALSNGEKVSVVGYNLKENRVLHRALGNNSTLPIQLL
jgi:hypothetical protein